MKSTVTGAQRVVALLAVVALAVVFSPSAFSQGRPAPGSTTIVDGFEAVAGEVLVRFTRPLRPADRVQLEAQLDVDDSESIGFNMRRFRSRVFDVQTLVSYFRSRDDVAYVEPNYVVRAISTPSDPQFGSLWGLLNTGQTIGQAGIAGADISATDAWDVSTGSTANVVAVVDTGIDYNHPDLAANVWSAPGPFTVSFADGTHVDCPAGSHGFNAIASDCNPFDDNRHGTHVSGTIGAVGDNGVGVAGVNWTASIMGAKFLSAGGSGTTANAIKAIEFAIQAKQIFGAGANVRVLSNSWGGGGYSQALADEISRANANDMLFVAAAGNNGSNNGTFPFYPASYNLANVVSVAATDNRDNLASFSNFGSNVHLGAPGVSVLSTTPGNTYAFFNGTSMATPHVAGAAALILSLPECSLDTAALKALILWQVDALGSLTGWVSTNGRLNVDKAIRSCGLVPPPTPPPPDTPPQPTGLAATPGDAQVVLTWNATPGAATYTVKRGISPSVASTIASGLVSPTYTDTGLLNNQRYYYAVSAVNAGGEGPISDWVSVTPTASTIPPAPTGLTATSQGKGKISLKWNAAAGAASYTLQRGTVNGGPYSTVAGGITSRTYVDSGLAKGTYYYVVFAVNPAGTSGNSNQASATAK